MRETWERETWEREIRERNTIIRQHFFFNLVVKDLIRNNEATKSPTKLI